jgi:hypothetical protein
MIHVTLDASYILALFYLCVLIYDRVGGKLYSFRSCLEHRNFIWFAQEFYMHQFNFTGKRINREKKSHVPNRPWTLRPISGKEISEGNIRVYFSRKKNHGDRYHCCNLSVVTHSDPVNKPTNQRDSLRRPIAGGRSTRHRWSHTGDRPGGPTVAINVQDAQREGSTGDGSADHAVQLVYVAVHGPRWLSFSCV